LKTCDTLPSRRGTKGVYEVIGFDPGGGKNWSGKLLRFRPMSNANPETHTFDSGDIVSTDMTEGALFNTGTPDSEAATYLGGRQAPC
jgi:hypothetical protein